MTRGIDHLVLCVNDLAKARMFYEAVGFTMTPQAQHPFGTGNIIAQLDGCFLEVLSVTQPDDIPTMPATAFNFAKFNQTFLATREGFSMLVLDSLDETADRTEFIEKELHVYDPFEFQRKAVLPSGEAVTVGFSLTFLDDPERLPGLGFFTCKQWRPDLFWKPDYQNHANGATTISNVYLVTPDTQSAADFLSNFVAADTTIHDDALSIVTSRGTLTAMLPSAFENRFPGHGIDIGTKPTFAGFSIQVTNIELAARHLIDAKVPLHAQNGRHYVDGRTGFGCLLEFVA